MRRLLRIPYLVAKAFLNRASVKRMVDETAGTAVPITFDMWFRQQIVGINRGPYWPVDQASRVTQWRNIVCGVDVSPGHMPGCYIQGLGRIEIGDYTRISGNVAIISENHDVYDLSSHLPGRVVIGRYCWLSFGATILPNVSLGDFTIVAAGAVVTKSFPEGYCVVAGNPAKIIRQLDPDRCVERKNPYEYHGFIKKDDFEAFRRSELKN
ncbi:MAG: acyltransferase [Pseudomonadota bacterium]